MTRSVFLAGGTGVIGRAALAALVAAGHDVTVNVRNAEADAWVRSQGARATTVDLFSPADVGREVDGHDTVINLTTAIPTGLRALRRRSWRTNDRIRVEVAPNLANAVPDGGTYIGESIAMSYADAGAAWVTEEGVRQYGDYDAAVGAAETAVRVASERGVTAIALRFAMFWHPDSAHTADIVRFARRGWWTVPGDDDAYISFLHPDDGGRAIVAALDAPSGAYNVAEPNPRTRAEHATVLADALGKTSLRRVPDWVQRRGGDPLQFLTRSLRISSAKLADATGWQPQVDTINHWPEITDQRSDIAG